jgi:hypothetical protein
MGRIIGIIGMGELTPELISAYVSTFVCSRGR